MEAWLAKLLFGIVVFVSNIIQALTGFAGTVLAMPFSILLVGKDYAKPILNSIGFFVCLIIAIKYHKQIDWKYVLIVSVFMGIGMIAGYFIEKFWYSKLFLRIYGGIVCLIAIYYFFIKNPIKFPKWINVIIMIISGIIHAIFVSGGPLLIIACKERFKNKDEFRATLAMIWVILNGIIIVGDVTQGLFTLEQLYLLLILIGTVIVSMLIGKILYKKISNEAFMKITCVLLFISGLSLIL